MLVTPNYKYGIEYESLKRVQQYTEWKKTDGVWDFLCTWGWQYNYKLLHQPSTNYLTLWCHWTSKTWSSVHLLIHLPKTIQSYSSIFQNSFCCTLKPHPNWISRMKPPTTMGNNRIPWTCLLSPRSRPNEQGHLSSAGSTGSKSNGDIADFIWRDGTWDVLFFLHAFPGFLLDIQIVFFVYELWILSHRQNWEKSNRSGEIQKNNRWWHSFVAGDVPGRLYI